MLRLKTAFKGAGAPPINSKSTLRHSITRDQSGITALEFALVMPVFLLMIIGIIELSSIMFTLAVMESATNITSRLGKTGYVALGTTREEQIVNSIKNRTAGMLDGNKIAIDSKVYTNFSNIGEPEPCIQPATPPCPGTAGTNFTDVNGNGSWDADMGLAGLGNPGDVVVYTVTYPWPIMTPLLSNIMGSTFNLTVRSVVRNEPYDPT